MKIAALCVAVGLVLPVAACTSDEGPLTWEEFRDQAYHEPGGVYIVNGDEPAETLDQLHEYYLGYLQSVEAADGIGSIQQGLAVNRVSGRDDRWSSSAAQNITYCVTRSGSGAFSTSEYNAVVSAMNTAASGWEGAARVNFVHNSGQDGSCTRNNGNVVFNVRRVCSGSFLASAFFPSFGRSSRQLSIDCSSFQNISPWTLAGILRHELGHTLGFRHEHTRPESGTCFENSSWRALTAYDSSSVMHYPQCNGTQGGDLVLTSRDRSGAAALYP
jgi:serralysin